MYNKKSATCDLDLDNQTYLFLGVPWRILQVPGTRYDLLGFLGDFVHLNQGRNNMCVSVLIHS